LLIQANSSQEITDSRIHLVTLTQTLNTQNSLGNSNAAERVIEQADLWINGLSCRQQDTQLKRSDCLFEDGTVAQTEIINGVHVLLQQHGRLYIEYLIAKADTFLICTKVLIYSQFKIIFLLL